MTAYWCERAWLGPGEVTAGVIVTIEGSRITGVTTSEVVPDGAFRLAGLTIPGFANCHSHAFHRALRGRTQRETGSFWTWRETMYAAAERLDPDTYYSLALATYQEMVLAGYTAVGEFHYLHHNPDGTPYDDPNAMGLALIAAAAAAGIRITLLDTCYLSAGFGAAPEGVQRRFSDGDAASWAERVANLATGQPAKDEHVRIGAAIHSVRAVPRPDLSTVAQALPDAPVHIHLSEQVAENDACMQRHGLTPTQLLAEEGVLDARLSAVHATHLSTADRAALGAARAYACFCPTTERDLADGVGPAAELLGDGAHLTLGSDSHAVIDPFEEMRAVELDARLATQQRGHLRAADLLVAGTSAGHDSLGFDDAGRIAVGCWADLVTIDDRSPRTAGTGAGEETVVFAAATGDIRQVVAGGRRVDLDPAGVGARLSRAIAGLEAW